MSKKVIGKGGANIEKLRGSDAQLEEFCVVLRQDYGVWRWSIFALPKIMISNPEPKSPFQILNPKSNIATW